MIGAWTSGVTLTGEILCQIKVEAWFSVLKVNAINASEFVLIVIADQ
jgi:hypothetical protein